MKRFVLVLATVVVAASTVMAQQMSVGPSLLWKGGVNTGEIPTGSKTSANFNAIPDVAATFRYLFNRGESIGVTVDLGYAQYTYKMRPENESVANDDNTIINKTTYFNIAPMLYFGGFQIGTSFGIPLAYNLRRVSGVSTGDIESSNMALNVELRIGGMIPVYRDDMGQINVVIQGGYMLTGVIDKNSAYYGDGTFNPKVASFGLGVNYLFNLSGKK